jgi:hypothetical protein
MQEKEQLHSTHNFMFWFHLFITSLAWVGPFLFSWQWMIGAYTIIMLQFLVFKKCLLNDKHELAESEDSTFYTYLLETQGFKVNRPLIKFIVRKVLYPVFGVLTLILQLHFGYKPLLF